MLVAPGICRYTAHGVIGARPWNNKLDFIVGGASAGERLDNIEEVGKYINGAYYAEVRPLLGGSFTYNGVRWVDLDSEDGSVGETNEALPSGAPPWSGAGGPDDLPANVSVLVTKVVAAGRGKRKGRFFFPGVPEGDTNENILTETDWGLRMPAFLTKMNAGSGQLVVVHTRTPDSTPSDPSPEPIFTGHDLVTSLVTQTLLATQRRRLRK